MKNDDIRAAKPVDEDDEIPVLRTVPGQELPIIGTLNVDEDTFEYAPGFDKSILQKWKKQTREFLSKSEE